MLFWLFASQSQREGLIASYKKKNHRYDGDFDLTGYDKFQSSSAFAYPLNISRHASKPQKYKITPKDQHSKAPKIPSNLKKLIKANDACQMSRKTRT